MKDKKALIEAALFVSETPLDLNALSKISGITSTESLKEVMEEIKKDLNDTAHGIELALTAEGYQFQVKDQFLDKVANLTTYSDISKGALRTLSLVALKGSILQSEVIKVQGNKAYNYIKSLEKKKLIRAEKAGRTKKINTTKEFEKYFGRSLDEIKEKLKSQELPQSVNVTNTESS
jgi:segregation and condensation protein B